MTAYDEYRSFAFKSYRRFLLLISPSVAPLEWSPFNGHSKCGHQDLSTTQDGEFMIPAGSVFPRSKCVCFASLSFCFFCFMLWSAVSIAQTTISTGSIQGSVTDP